MTAHVFTATEKADFVELHLQALRDQLERRTYQRKGMPADDVERMRERLAYRAAGVEAALADLRLAAREQGRAA